MKYMTINLEDHKIELHNNLLGKESVFVNDQKVSSVSSLFGTEHNFEVSDGEASTKYMLKTKMGRGGVAIDLYKNGSPVIESPVNNQLKYFVLFVCVIVFLNLIF